MTYPDAIAHLGRARRFGMKLGLDPMHALAERLGNPQHGLRFIHLAGSNGKGSTAAFIESCLRVAGHRVGLYTSPHLVSIRERIQTDREPISESAFGEGMAAVVAAAKGEPTFFELMTALALWQFAREKVDWVVWETGLGGRLDATNIVVPEVSVITSLALEHTEYLGSTIEEIAREKAGIIKPGVPVVYAGFQTAAREVITLACERQASPLIDPLNAGHEWKDLGLRDGRQHALLEGRDYELGLVGPHQVRNAACALAALRVVATLPSEVLAKGLATTFWPGRFQIVSESPPIVLDGAHNPAAMEELIKTWRAFLASRGLPPGKAELVFAMSADKDITGMVSVIGKHFSTISFPRLASERAAEPATLAERFHGASEKRLLHSVAHWRPSGFPALIAGSLFLAGEMLAHLQGAEHEIKLNERLESSPLQA